MSDTPLQVAVEAARAAGRILKERADSIGKIQYKGEIDPVTEVDLLCEQEVIGRIQKRFRVTRFSPKSPAQPKAMPIICGSSIRSTAR